MSQDVDREKVLQTTKVRTSIKSDLSWIQKIKKAEEQDSSTGESTVPTEDGTSPSLRQLSYVLMTAKKFEPDTSSENGLQNGKHLEPVEPEPALTITEEKNHVEPPKPNDSAEVSTKVEELIVNNTTSVDESVTCSVPDILVESAFKTSPPQENSNEGSKTKALDILSDSLVEPILHVNPLSETAADQNALDMLSDSLVKPILDFNPSSVEVPKEPEIPAIETVVPQDNAEETQLTSTKEVSASVEVHVAQNDLELVKASEETKVSDSVEVTDVLQEKSESNETQSTKEDEVETVNGEINVQNEVEPVKASEEATVEPKEPEISTIVTDVPKDNVDVTATDIVQSGTINAEVTEQKAADMSVSLPNGDTSTNVDSTITQDSAADQGITEAVLSEEVIVDQKSSVQESKITEVVDAGIPCPPAESTPDNVNNEVVQEEIVEPDNTNIAVDPEGAAQIDEEEKTPAKESPENSNTVETPNQSAGEIAETITNGPESENTAKDVEEKALIPETEIVIDAIPAEESTVSEIIESEQKQTNPVLCTETLAEPLKENAEDLNKVEVQASLETPEVAENVETAVPSSPVLDEIFKAEPVVVVSSPESPASEVEESSPLENTATEETSEDILTETKIEPKVESTPVVPSVASENQTAVEIDVVVAHSEQSKEEGGALEITDALDEATADKTVNGFEGIGDSSGEKQPTDNISVPSSEEKEETSFFIMRDGKEVCSHCDQFIGLIKLTFSYPPKYLHPECLTCGVCTMVLGDLLTPMFEHNQLIYCSECYDKVYSLT